MTVTDIPAPELLQLPVGELHPAADNPRTSLGDLAGLVESIHAVGIIEPLVVTFNGPHGYTVVAGHRRLAAALEAGLSTVPCVTRAFDTTRERVEVMVIENLQRQDLDPLDEARGFQLLVDHGHTQRNIAERIGCNQSHVSRRLSLLGLNDGLRTAVVEGRIDLRVAERAAKLDDAAQAELVKSDGPISEWRVEDAEREAKKAAARAEGAASGLPEVTDYQERWKLDATDERDGAVGWLLEYSGEIRWLHPKPEPDPAEASEPAERAPSEWELRRQRHEAIETERHELLVRLLAEDAPRVRATGLQLIVDELTAENAQEVFLEPLDKGVSIDPVEDDHALVVAVAAIAGFVQYGLDEEDGYNAELDARARTLWAALAEDLHHDTVGIAPDAAEVQAEPEIVEEDADDEVQLVFGEPVNPTWLTAKPWGTYDNNDVARRCQLVTQLSTAERVRHVATYELAHDGHDQVVQACGSRLVELGDRALTW